MPPRTAPEAGGITPATETGSYPRPWRSATIETAMPDTLLSKLLKRLFRGENQPPTQGPKPDVAVVALWRHNFPDAVTKARELRDASSGRRVVLAELVNGELVRTSKLHELHKEGIDVVPVSAIHAKAADDDEALKAEIATLLENDDRLAEQEKRAKPPKVDSEAAKAVTEAFERLEQLTPAQQREFLRQYYGADASDDGVR
jgi:hypothetical protein